ncbi:hypothetical protein [Prescottella agglutinans]|uniref:hypothetical protein n=1 Tax=Prescottella agglutinans TaxID=1644129 RepID=UPI003D983510
MAHTMFGPVADGTGGTAEDPTRLRRRFTTTRELGGIGALGEQPVSLGQLPDHLLRGVPLPLRRHGVLNTFGPSATQPVE